MKPSELEIDTDSKGNPIYKKLFPLNMVEYTNIDLILNQYVYEYCLYEEDLWKKVYLIIGSIKNKNNVIRNMITDGIGMYDMEISDFPLLLNEKGEHSLFGYSFKKYIFDKNNMRLFDINLKRLSQETISNLDLKRWTFDKISQIRTTSDFENADYILHDIIINNLLAKEFTSYYPDCIQIFESKDIIEEIVKIEPLLFQREFTNIVFDLYKIFGFNIDIRNLDLEIDCKYEKEENPLGLYNLISKQDKNLYLKILNSNNLIWKNELWKITVFNEAIKLRKSINNMYKLLSDGLLWIFFSGNIDNICNFPDQRYREITEIVNGLPNNMSDYSNIDHEISHEKYNKKGKIKYTKEDTRTYSQRYAILQALIIKYTQIYYYNKFK